MVVTETCTYLFVGFEASVWSPHLYARRLERIVSWKTKFSVVDSALVGTIFKSENAKVPIENVLLLRSSDEIFKVFPLK